MGHKNHLKWLVLKVHMTDLDIINTHSFSLGLDYELFNDLDSIAEITYTISLLYPEILTKMFSIFSFMMNLFSCDY